MRAAVYARVSSAVQRDRHTIASQLRVLPEFIRGRGWDLAGKPYIDDGRTAKAGHLEARTGLTALLRDAAAHKFDVVVVVDLDRLTRSEDMTERGAILGGFQRAGVKIAIASTGQVIDFSDSMGDLFGSLQAYFAADWARKHRTRIMEGKLTAIARGKKPAGPTPYGYRYDRETGVWSVHDGEAEVVREIFTRCAANETGNAIADDLNRRGVPRLRSGAWTRERIYGLLRQPAYRGEWVADKAKKLVVPTPRIIDDEVWFAARDRAASIARQRKGLRRTKHVYLLEAIAVCGMCGAPVGITTGTLKHYGQGKSPPKYVCSRRRRPDERGRCDAPYWLVSAIDRRVWGAIRETVLVPGRIERAARAAQVAASEDGRTWQADLKAAERRLASLQRAQSAVLARFRGGLVNEEVLDVELAASKREIEQAKQQIDAARRAQVAAGTKGRRAAGLEELVADLCERVDAVTPEEKRALVASMFSTGAVTLTLSTIEMSAKLRRPTGSVRAAGYSSDNETSVEIRLVA